MKRRTDAVCGLTQLDLVLLVALLSFIAAFGSFVSRRVGRQEALEKWVGCKTNLKNLSTACEMYSTDYAGKYPARLGQLVPNYQYHIPACPAAVRDTYSAGFQSVYRPDAYTIFCVGDNHRRAGEPPGYPQFNSRLGLVTKVPAVDSPEHPTH